MEFLWVHWFGRDLSTPGGFGTQHLHWIGFLSNDAFGFIDPWEVIRAVNLIPAFFYGKMEDLLRKSIGRQANQDDKDCVYYYVGM